MKGFNALWRGKIEKTILRALWPFEAPTAMVGGWVGGVKKTSKLDKKRFFRNLPNVTPNVWDGKEPKFKYYPGLVRVLTLSFSVVLINLM